MKVLLTALNAKYIHSSLAVAYLKSYCTDEIWKIDAKEYSINENIENIMADIYEQKPDILAFSCYIWNIELILKLCADFKKISPTTVIILGGPEVSYNSVQIIKENKAVDFIIRGEGELVLKELLSVIYHEGDLSKINGITYQKEGQIYYNPDQDLIKNLDIIPNPYNEENLAGYYKNKVIYYETSRGCPFNCSYCLSSTIRGVRYFSLTRVKHDLLLFIKQRVKEVKLVDRTFNCNEKRAREIMEFIIENNFSTRFHFEIGAELFSDEMLEFLKKVPPGMFDFEIGVQSTCSETLKAVNRSGNWIKAREKIRKLTDAGNIHIHLDLIAGLPFEDYERFGKSFNDVYNLNPHVIQLGFLKLLKGSKIREEEEKYGYKFQAAAPYQVLENNYISYYQLIKLKQIEELLERYYNSGGFKNTLLYLSAKAYKRDAFLFFQELADFWNKKGYFNRSHKKETEYSILQSFIAECLPPEYLFAQELLKYDYFINNQSHTLPSGFTSYNPENAGEILYTLLKNSEFVAEYLTGWIGKTPREIRRNVHLEYLPAKVIDKDKNPELIPVLFVYDSIKKKALKIIDINKWVS